MFGIPTASNEMSTRPVLSIASINGLVLGVGIALLGTQLLGSSSQAVAITAGAVSGIAYVALVYRYQVRRYSAAAAAGRRRWESGS